MRNGQVGEWGVSVWNGSSTALDSTLKLFFILPITNYIVLKSTSEYRYSELFITFILARSNNLISFNSSVLF